MNTATEKKTENRLLARIDLNLVLQAMIAAALLWFGRVVLESRDLSRTNTLIITQQVELLEKFDLRLSGLQTLLNDRWTGTHQRHFEERLFPRIERLEDVAHDH